MPRAPRYPAVALVGAALLLAGCATTTSPVPPRQGTTVPPGQDVRLAVYNVALGAVVGGVGALANGDDGPALRRLARGAGRGAVGGTVAYSGKWALGEISRTGQLAYAWPARLLHDAGTSVVENAAHDRPPLDRLASHLGFVRLDVRPASGDVRARLLPLNAVAFGVMLADDGSAFDLRRTLALTTPVFVGDGRGRMPITGGTGDGFAFLGSVYLDRQDDDLAGLVAHEMVHVFQHHEHVRAAALYAGLDGPLRRSGAYRAAARWVYLDNVGIQAAAYFAVEGGDIDAPCKYDNWFEREAEAFGTRRGVGVCP